MLTPKTNSQTSQPKQLYTWWMEPPSMSIQHQPFQLSKLHSSDARKGCKKVIVKKGLPPNRNQWEIWYREPVQGLQTVPISTASASPGIFRSESQELDLISSTEKLVALCQTSESNKGDKMWNSQEWQTDARSIASTEKPVAWDSVIDVDLETWREYKSSLCRISFIHRMSEHEIADDEKPSSRGQNGRHWQTLSHQVCVYVFNHDRSRFSWTRLLRQPAFNQKYRRETHCKEIVRGVSKMDSRTKIRNLWSVRNKLGNFFMGKAILGERRRSNQSLKGMSFVYSLILKWWKKS